MTKGKQEQLREAIERAHDVRLKEVLLVYADWLEEQGDSLAAGYRLLAARRREPRPVSWSDGFWESGSYVEWCSQELAETQGQSHHLPQVVMARLRGGHAAPGARFGYETRLEAFDDAAQAYAAAAAHGKIDRIGRRKKK